MSIDYCCDCGTPYRQYTTKLMDFATKTKSYKVHVPGWFCYECDTFETDMDEHDKQIKEILRGEAHDS